MVLHLLFVCTGNICRSPTAERLTAAYASKFEVPGLTASSAGTRAMIAHPVHHDAALVLESLGGDATAFAARQLTPQVASSADLVIAMTAAHRDRVLELAPNRLKRTFTLTEASILFADAGAKTVADVAVLRPRLAAYERSDVTDPIGHSPAVFAEVGQQIADLLQPVLDFCRRTAVVSD